MSNSNSKKDTYLSPTNRKYYLVGLSVCMVIILLTFVMPIFSVYGQNVSLFGMLGLASGLNSFGSFLGVGDIGDTYLSVLFPIVFLPAIIIAIISYLNLSIRNKGYSIFTIILSAVASVYTMILLGTISSFAMGVKSTPLVLQIICYIAIAVMTFVFITRGEPVEPIRRPAASKNRSDYNVSNDDVIANGKEQIKDLGKKLGSSINKVVDTSKNTIANSGMNRFEAENFRLKNAIETIKKEIGEYVYNAGISDEDIERYIAEIDANYVEIGKNKEEILKKDGKKICERCGNISKEESKFCNECGFNYSERKGHDDRTYINLSKSKIDISKMTAEIKEIIDKNEKKLSDVDRQLLKIGDTVYGRVDRLDDSIEEKKNRISGLEMKIEENRREYLKEKGLKICPNCGNEIHEGSKFCDQCGMSVAEAEKVSNEKESSAEENISAEIPSDYVQASEAQKCKFCGTELSSEDTFCPECGNRVK